LQIEAKNGTFAPGGRKGTGGKFRVGISQDWKSMGSGLRGYTRKCMTTYQWQALCSTTRVMGRGPKHLKQKEGHGKAEKEGAIVEW